MAVTNHWRGMDDKSPATIAASQQKAFGEVDPVLVEAAAQEEAMGRMTLAELEAVASRFEAAVKIIREAQALLGPAGGARENVAEPPLRRTPGPPLPPPTAPNWTPAELAERARLKQQFNAGLPENIKALEEQ